MALYDVTITVRVANEDRETLFRAAWAHAITKDGMTGQDATEMLRPEGRIDVKACLQMLLDPGVSPDGCDIEESNVELLTLDDDDPEEE